MIESVTDHLAAQLKALPFLDVVGGIARKQKIKVGEIHKVLPAAKRLDNPSKYVWLTPASNLSGVAYFENLGNELFSEVSGGKGGIYKATIRVVVWLNMSRISPPDKGVMMSQVITTIQGRHENVFGLQSLNITPKAEVPQSPDIFRDYTYNEEELQFLMLPYDYFAFDFIAIYAVSSSCLMTNIVKKNPEC